MDEKQLYKDAIYFHLIRQGYSEFKSKLIVNKID